jgi:hypothetical protein
MRWCYNEKHNDFDTRQVGWHGSCQFWYYQKHDLGKKRIPGGACDIREVVIVDAALGETPTHET